jgi:hypothetical protein
MTQIFLYMALGLLAAGYLLSVASCMFDSRGDEWWEPWVMGAVLPVFAVCEQWRSIVGVVGFFAAFALVVWLVALVGDLFRWVGSLV